MFHVLCRTPTLKSHPWKTGNIGKQGHKGAFKYYVSRMGGRVVQAKMQIRPRLGGGGLCLNTDDTDTLEGRGGRGEA